MSGYLVIESNPIIKIRLTQNTTTYSNKFAEHYCCSGTSAFLNSNMHSHKRRRETSPTCYKLWLVKFLQRNCTSSISSNSKHLQKQKSAAFNLWRTTSPKHPSTNPRTRNHVSNAHYWTLRFLLLQLLLWRPIFLRNNERNTALKTYKLQTMYVVRFRVVD